MALAGTEFGLKLMHVVGAQMGVTYLSAAISTGYRDLSLMRELGVSKEELRQKYPLEYRERVIGPNEREAAKFAQMARELGRGRLVVNPAALTVPGWSQVDYMAFWEETIRTFSLEVILSPGWELSSGARREAAIALETGLKLLDIKGRELAAIDLMMVDTRMRSKLAAEGFVQAVIDSYVPVIDYEAIAPTFVDLTDQSQKLAQMAWQSKGHIQDGR